MIEDVKLPRIFSPAEREAANPCRPKSAASRTHYLSP